MSNTFFISDTHFFHKNIIQYSSRPFSSVEEMNEAMINNWNDMVKPNDEVYHLGDVSFSDYKNTKTLLRRLNGNINIILGNHDKVIIKNDKDLISSKTISTIQHYKEIRANPMIVLFHFGCRVWNQSHRGSILCYGHSHGSLLPFGKSVDVGVDCKEITDEYRPISIEELLLYMKNRN